MIENHIEESFNSFRSDWEPKKAVCWNKRLKGFNSFRSDWELAYALAGLSWEAGFNSFRSDWELPVSVVDSIIFFRFNSFRSDWELFFDRLWLNLILVSIPFGLIGSLDTWVTAQEKRKFQFLSV